MTSGPDRPRSAAGNRSSRTATAALVMLLLLAGCGDGERCQGVCPAIACVDPFSLAVADAVTHQPIPTASASSPGLTCSAEAGFVRCAAGTGTYPVVVSAPGYASQEVVVTVGPPFLPTPCECPKCQAWQPMSVSLAPAG